MQFTKLFSSILDSTIWQEPAETKIVWITMLAMVDRNGEVHASVPGLARRAGVTLQQCESALECLSSPDPYSRTTDHEGRRIDSIDGGWTLLNHGKYRALLSKEERREYNRQKQAEYRARKRLDVNDTSITVGDNEQNAHITDADADADPEEEIPVEESNQKASPPEYPPEVIAFWKAYPASGKARSSRKKTQAAWKSIKAWADPKQILQSIQDWSRSEQWIKDGGQYVPALDRWLRDRKFEDDPPLPARTSKGGLTSSQVSI